MNLCSYYRLLVTLLILISHIPPSAQAQQTCPPEWNPPIETGSLSILALLKDVPVKTKWQDLPITMKAQLQQFADERLTAFRVRWGKDALAKKERILFECPTQEMTSAIDNYYLKRYNTYIPPTFSLKDLKSAALTHALLRNYLGTIAAERATITYPSGKIPNQDWDGKSTFDSIRLPDEETFNDIRNYMGDVVKELKSIDDATLDDFEKAVKQRVLFDARENAAGGGNYGDGDMESACHIADLDYDVLGGYERDNGRPRIFANDDDVIREVNAIYLNNMPLKWLDVGTLNSALNYCNFTGLRHLVQSKVGDPSTNDVAKGMILLKEWWIERVSTSDSAQNKCSVYSSADRARIWEAFSASQLFNNEGSSTMDSYRVQLEAYIKSKRDRYRELAKHALKLVFPNNTVLTRIQRKKVIAAIDNETVFGLFPQRVAEAIDTAQGAKNGSAAMQWKKAIAKHVIRIGGRYDQNDHIRPEEETALKAMFEEVKTWVAQHYQGYPINIVSLYPDIEFAIDTHSNSPETVFPGKITIGVGTKRSKLEYYSWIIHELRHAVNFARIKLNPDKISDEGFAEEGSGVAVEALLLEPFAKQVMKDNMAYTLNALDYGIRDARFAGTTDATLQKYFRSDCSGSSDANTIDFTKKIAANYGLTGQLADTVALRSHAGTQYFQYIPDGQQMLDAISYLQSQIDVSEQHRIDPFILFACELNVPNRDAKYIAKLKACMKI